MTLISVVIVLQIFLGVQMLLWRQAINGWDKALESNKSILNGWRKANERSAWWSKVCRTMIRQRLKELGCSDVDVDRIETSAIVEVEREIRERN